MTSRVQGESVRGRGAGGEEPGLLGVSAGLGAGAAPGPRHLPLQRLLLRQVPPHPVELATNLQEVRNCITEGPY